MILKKSVNSYIFSLSLTFPKQRINIFAILLFKGGENMKKIYGGIIAIFLLVVVAVATPSAVSAEINHTFPNQLYGCMPDAVAARLIESGAFTTSGGVAILCVEGYTPVYRVLF